MPLYHGSLPEEIHTATRHVHAHLNRLIIARLPFALPPHSRTPYVYSFGLLHFARIYLTFETLWCSLTGDALSGTVEDRTCNCASLSKPRRLQSILARLYMPELQRSTRMKRDLTRFLGPKELETHLQKLGGQRTQSFINHIEQVVTRKPHTMLAYAWVMYMALFNGGRWMRTQLLAVGEDFWAQCDTDDGNKDAIEQVGLGFFHFNDNMDGEDIKGDFKRRLADVERLLSADERKDIVAEASEIFYHCQMLVEELDDMMVSSVMRRSANVPLPSPALPASQLLLKHALPLGLVELSNDIVALLRRTWNARSFLDQDKKAREYLKSSGR